MTCRSVHSLDTVGAAMLELNRRDLSSVWTGKTFDLSAGNRQLPISPSSLWCSLIVIHNLDTKLPEIYSMVALPFGANRSVYAFLRMAHAIWWVGCMALSIVWSSFFGDYITLSKKSASVATNHCVLAFFQTARLAGVAWGERPSLFRDQNDPVAQWCHRVRKH